MPGRPRKKAKQVGALEDKTIELFMDLFTAMPRQWLEAEQEMRNGKRSDIRDPNGRLWIMAYWSAQHAIGAFEDVGNAMRRKAGIEGPSMWQECLDTWLGNDRESDGAACGNNVDGETEPI